MKDKMTLDEAFKAIHKISEEIENKGWYTDAGPVWEILQALLKASNILMSELTSTFPGRIVLFQSDIDQGLGHCLSEVRRGFAALKDLDPWYEAWASHDPTAPGDGRWTCEKCHKDLGPAERHPAGDHLIPPEPGSFPVDPCEGERS